MRNKNVQCVFHYIPLHSAPAGLKFGKFEGEDINTTKESNRLVRLPLYYNISRDDLEYVIRCINEYFGA